MKLNSLWKIWRGDRNFLLSYCVRSEKRFDILRQEDKTPLQLFQKAKDLQMDGVLNIQLGFSSLLFTFDPVKHSADSLLNELLRNFSTGSGMSSEERHRVVEIPVCYDEEFGLDLDEVANITGMTKNEIIGEHSTRTFSTDFLGFMPGFAYLSGLPKKLEVSRLNSSRTSVPSGSIGIARSQTAVYPASSPGGWRIIGRTPIEMFNAQRLPMFLLSPGDQVHFTPISKAEFITSQQQQIEIRKTREALRASKPAPRQLTVLDPGLSTTVQDLGRLGYGHVGISPSGAADPRSLIAGNRLVGNPDGMPALEMTLIGGAYRFDSDAVVAITGSDFSPVLDGAPVAGWQPLQVKAHQILRLSSTRQGARAYLCVQGGIDVPLVLGSASTHVSSGLGGLNGRALAREDLLSIGDSTINKISIYRRPALPMGYRMKEFRAILGPDSDLFTNEQLKAFFASSYIVTKDCNRFGIRLCGRPIPVNERWNDFLSCPVALGTIQISPDGQPTILFVDQQTTGGYPQIACIAAADHHSLGQLLPGDEIRLRIVSVQEAADSAREEHVAADGPAYDWGNWLAPV